MREDGKFRPLSFGQAHGTDPHGIPRTRLNQKNPGLTGCLGLVGFFLVPGAECALVPGGFGLGFAHVPGPGSAAVGGFLVALAVRAGLVGSVGVLPF